MGTTVKSTTLLVCALVFAQGAVSLAQDNGPATVIYSSLSDHQKALFRAYVDKHASGAHEESFYQSYWSQTLSTGEPTTFASITHALEHTSIGNGRSGLDDIDQVVAIFGDIPQNPSYQQFNLEVVWKAGAYDDFVAASFTYRPGTGHTGETGLSLLSSSEGLHLLFAKDGTANGHIHIDYRLFSLGDVFGGGEGHMMPYNSDVRAVGPERDTYGNVIDNHARHVQWWGALPGYMRR